MEKYQCQIRLGSKDFQHFKFPFKWHHQYDSWVCIQNLFYKSIICNYISYKSTLAKYSTQIDMCGVHLCDRATQITQWQRIHSQCRRHRFDPWVRKIPCRRKWQPTRTSSQELEVLKTHCITEAWLCFHDHIPQCCWLGASGHLCSPRGRHSYQGWKLGLCASISWGVQNCLNSAKDVCAFRAGVDLWGCCCPGALREASAAPKSFFLVMLLTAGIPGGGVCSQSCRILSQWTGWRGWVDMARCSDPKLPQLPLASDSWPCPMNFPGHDLEPAA